MPLTLSKIDSKRDEKNGAGNKSARNRALAWRVLPTCIVGVLLVGANLKEAQITRIAGSLSTPKYQRTTTGASDAEQSPPSEAYPNLYCTWNASHGGGEDCRAKLTAHICDKDNGDTAKASSRMLLLGDSTFKHMDEFVRQQLLTPHDGVDVSHGPHNIQCRWRDAGRCNNQEFYGFKNEPVQGWRVQPKPAQEGPTSFGLQNPGCDDCSGCNGGLLFCTPPNPGALQAFQPTTQQYPYQAGHINVEFARDVILQTQFHNTSQENIALFLHRDYNSPVLVEAFGKPYCFANAGFHDMMIPNITTKVFVENVKWYLQVLQPECHSIVWVSLTAPLDNPEYLQTTELALEWNQAVHRMLVNTEFHGRKIPFMDVFNASISFEHADNIHMHGNWYKALGSFIGDLVKGCAQASTSSSSVVG